jgi:Bacterial regulatory proteins, tetR family
MPIKNNLHKILSARYFLSQISLSESFFNPLSISNSFILCINNVKLTSLTTILLAMPSKIKSPEDREKLRTNILDAAWSLFVERGLEAVPMREIAKKSIIQPPFSAAPNNTRTKRTVIVSGSPNY